jgi:hypothetical protein
MREAQRTRSTFSVEVSRTVDVISILRNIPPCYASRYNLQVKKWPTLTTRNTSNNKRVYDLFIVQFIQTVGKMLQDLFYFDNAEVNATLRDLNRDTISLKP